MTLRVVGAGLGRTGTSSLKVALEQLLGAPCYHMFEVLAHPEHIEQWQLAADGGSPDWHRLFEGYAAAVDWPAASFWPEIAEAFPEAIVLLSVRPTDEWWRSADETIWAVSRRPAPPGTTFEQQQAMIRAVLANRFTPQWSEEQPSKEAYDRHNADVRARVPKERLLEWAPRDGWGPICEALGLPVPEAPFPHTNSTADFRAMTGLDASPPS